MIDEIGLINIGLQNPDAYNNIIDYYKSYINLEKMNMKKKLDNQINYKIIEHIPFIILIFSIICLILIYYSSQSEYNSFISNLLDKFCNLFIGMTIIIIGVYLLTFRFEYKYKINAIRNFNIEMQKIIDINNILRNN